MYRRPFKHLIGVVFRREEALTEADVARLAEGKMGAAPNLQNNGGTGGAAAGAAAGSPPPGGAGTGKEGAAAGAAAGAGAAPPDQPINIDIRTLGFKSQDEFTQRFNQIPTLERDLQEAKAQPKFKSDRAKWLYDFANGVEGMELDRAQQVLSLVRTPVKDLPDQQARFEAFKLKPENKGLSQDDVMALFQDYENDRFGQKLDAADPANEQKNRTRDIKIKQATDLARQEIQKIVDEYDKTRPVELTPEQLLKERAEYEAAVSKQLADSGFAGLDLTITALGEDGKTPIEGKVNYKLDANQMKTLAAAITDPHSMWVEVLRSSGSIDKEGRPVADKFASLLTNLLYSKEMHSQIYKQGRDDERVALLKGRRNPTDNNPPGGAPPAFGAGAPSGDELEKAGAAAAKMIGG